jgi:hypothetical protein
VLPKSILRRAIPEYYLFAGLLSWWLYCIVSRAASEEPLDILWPLPLAPMTSATVAVATKFEAHDRTTTLWLERATPRNVTPRFSASRREEQL